MKLSCTVILAATFAVALPAQWEQPGPPPALAAKKEPQKKKAEPYPPGCVPAGQLTRGRRTQTGAPTCVTR